MNIPCRSAAATIGNSTALGMNQNGGHNTILIHFPSPRQCGRKRMPPYGNWTRRTVIRSAWTVPTMPQPPKSQNEAVDPDIMGVRRTETNGAWLKNSWTRRNLLRPLVIIVFGAINVCTAWQLGEA